MGEKRLLLKQLVTMEVIQWTTLWEFAKHEYENEKNLLGGALGAKAAEDLKLRIIEHVLLTLFLAYTYSYLALYACPLNLTFCSLQNILVVSKYYSRITLKRLADLLCLSLQVCIFHLCMILYLLCDANCGILCLNPVHDNHLNCEAFYFIASARVAAEISNWHYTLLFSGGREASFRHGELKISDCED
jgi:hypothetical protein